MTAAERLRQMVNGYQVAQALHVAAMLGISDLLAAGPRTVVGLATAADADPDAGGRLLHALSTAGSTSAPTMRVTATPTSAPLSDRTQEIFDQAMKVMVLTWSPDLR
jgi:hypothetical protein